MYPTFNWPWVESQSAAAAECWRACASRPLPSGPVYSAQEQSTREQVYDDCLRSSTANRLSIPDRGLVKEGFYADLVLFDPSTIANKATYENPHQVSVGIQEVFVNGVAVVHDGKVTGAKPGRMVRGPGYRP